MNWATKLFSWVSEKNRAKNTREPDAELKDTGYVFGNQPLAEHHNFLFALFLDALKELQTVTGSHIDNKDNPHSVTAKQVGLGNVDNTSDENKPVSKAQQEAIDRTLEAAKEYADQNGGATIKEIVIPKSGWTNEENGMYRNDVPVAEATYKQFPIVAIDGEDMSSAAQAEMSTEAEANDLSISFWAKNIPGKDINVTVALISPQREGGASGGGSGGGEEYVLPPATASRLGGVKVGKNIGVTVDGTISTDALMAADVASDEDLQALMTEIFGE